MSLVYEVRRRARHAAVPLFSALALGYFGYHAVQGDRGLVAWLHLSHEVAQVESELATVRSERRSLERQVTLLRPDGLDPDLLDERARVVLSFARADEVVFLNE